MQTTFITVFITVLCIDYIEGNYGKKANYDMVKEIPGHFNVSKRCRLKCCLTNADQHSVAGLVVTTDATTPCQCLLYNLHLWHADGRNLNIPGVYLEKRFGRRSFRTPLETTNDAPFVTAVPVPMEPGSRVTWKVTPINFMSTTFHCNKEGNVSVLEVSFGSGLTTITGKNADWTDASIELHSGSLLMAGNKHSVTMEVMSGNVMKLSVDKQEVTKYTSGLNLSEINLLYMSFSNSSGSAFVHGIEFSS